MQRIIIAIAIFIAEFWLNMPAPTPGVIASAMETVQAEQTAYGSGLTDGYGTEQTTYESDGADSYDAEQIVPAVPNTPATSGDSSTASSGYYLGTCCVTAYCACEQCCGKTDGITATGTHATQGRTVAVDPSVIPYGSTVYIDGVPYIAEDCGGAIGGTRIDLFFDRHSDALNWGVRYCEVWVG